MRFPSKVKKQGARRSFLPARPGKGLDDVWPLWGEGRRPCGKARAQIRANAQLFSRSRDLIRITQSTPGAEELLFPDFESLGLECHEKTAGGN